MNTVLKVENLQTSFFTDDGEVEAVRNVSFELREGEILGIVGESGSGKSVTVKSIMNIIKKPGKVKSGRIMYRDQDILNINAETIRQVKGNDIALIFQDPMTSLNPVFTVGNQLQETIRAHQKMPFPEMKQKAVEMLKAVRIPEAEKRMSQYPHEFSGGMRQRVVIAMALINDPDILIADEPTTALDVTIQDQILKLIKEIKEERDKSVILITHDLGVVAEMCRRVLVMYGGIVVEEGSREDIFYNPKHPYTKGLLKSMPNIESKERLIPIKGTPPNLVNPPAGCPFAARCDKAMKLCALYMPGFYEISDHQKTRCWLMDERVIQGSGADKGEA